MSSSINTPSRKTIGTLIIEEDTPHTLHPLSPPRSTIAPLTIDPLDGTVHNPLGVTVSLDDLVDDVNPLHTPKPMGNKPSSLNALQAQSGKQIHTIIHDICVASYLI